MPESYAILGSLFHLGAHHCVANRGRVRQSACHWRCNYHPVYRRMYFHAIQEIRNLAFLMLIAICTHVLDYLV